MAVKPWKSSLRTEELEISLQEKNDIIEKLSAELDKAGKQIDQMGLKLNNNMMDISFEQVSFVQITKN